MDAEVLSLQSLRNMYLNIVNLTLSAHDTKKSQQNDIENIIVHVIQKGPIHISKDMLISY